jgi:Cell wall-associated hydrolases (invasion-associated proteins)
VKWLGHPYRYAGAPGLDGSGYWDCSSFVNYICAVKFGLPIPGYAAGRWTGSNHGPTTFQWAVWPGISKVSRADVQAGDIIVYQKDFTGHMGIAVSNTMMVHAPNPKKGTVISSIDGESKPIVRMARYT